jgi:hypothetical protein
MVNRPFGSAPRATSQRPIAAYAQVDAPRAHTTSHRSQLIDRFATTGRDLFSERFPDKY